MEKKKTRKAIYAFIDSQNLNLGVKSQGWNLDFAKFRRYLTDKYRVSKAFLFIGMVPGNESLYKSLSLAGYVCIFKPTLEHKEGKKTVIKGNVDAELVLHTMIEYPNYNQAIIVSGDGDFFCLVEHLEKNKKLLKIFAPTRHYSSLLRKYNNYIVRIDLLKKALEYQKTGIRGRSKP
ncbi:MAG: hypothetical protein UX62_C0015G0004 [Microgenomates group bacterium GW2011_GWA2_46_7]|nr:MAG: hypothetical protein UX62_C0015G0004 [Microgenomates group bacterium GW2011_GWA2_46_7]KKU46698.1 MAG: hypothetical protein UX64_C0004G0010 [Microgenomates group bacterium GW2011_GWC2_46_7]